MLRSPCGTLGGWRGAAGGLGAGGLLPSPTVQASGGDARWENNLSKDPMAWLGCGEMSPAPGGCPGRGARGAGTPRDSPRPGGVPAPALDRGSLQKSLLHFETCTMRSQQDGAARLPPGEMRSEVLHLGLGAEKGAGGFLCLCLGFPKPAPCRERAVSAMEGCLWCWRC